MAALGRLMRNSPERAAARVKALARDVLARDVEREA
jgi:hypothetical protein